MKEINLLSIELNDENPVETWAGFKSEKEQKQFAKRVVEALLFCSHESLSFQKIKAILDTQLNIKPRVLKDIIEDLQEEYIQQNRAFRLVEIEQGYLLKTCSEYSSFVEELLKTKRLQKLSSAASEVLAIIAYKQPITRVEIEGIRGVDCSGIVQSLIEKGLIQENGKKDVAGRPTLYIVSSFFLSYFGLKDLKDLPLLDTLDAR